MSNLPFVELTGRALGALAGAIVSVLWMYAIWFPTDALGMSGASVAVAWLMALLGIFGTIAGVRGHAGLLFVVFLASFLPVGAYMLYVTGWPRWIGIADCALLAASTLIAYGARPAGRERRAGSDRMS